MSSPQRPNPTTPRGPRPQAPSAPSGGLNVNINPIKLARQNLLLLMITGFMGIVLGVASHFALLYTYPNYTSEAYFEFFAPQLVAGQNPDADADVKELEIFIKTQVALMVQDQILQATARDPDIRNQTEWHKQFVGENGLYDPDEAAIELREVIGARPLRDTKLAKLYATVTDPNEAAIIARAATSAYMRVANQRSTSSSQDQLEALTRRLNAAQESRRTLENEKADFFTGDLDITSLDERTTFQHQLLSRLTIQLAELQSDLTQERDLERAYTAQLNAPGAPQYPETVRAEVDFSPIIQSFEQQIAFLKAQQSSLLQKFGPNHRQVQRVQDEIFGQEAEMELQRSKLLSETFQKQLDLSRTTISQLEADQEDMLAQIEEVNEYLADFTERKEQYNRIEGDLERLAKTIDDLENQVSNLRALGQQDTSARVSVVDEARIPDEPSFPKIETMVPLVTLLLTGLVSGVIVLREVLELRIRSAADATLIPRLRVLGVIPDMSEDLSRIKRFETAVLDHPKGVLSESFRQARNEILKKMDRSGIRSLLIATGMPDSGGTGVVMNLAASIGSTQRRVLIIDANFRRPALHDRTGLPATPGLSDVLTKRVAFEDAVRESDIPHCDVLTCGDSDSGGYEMLSTGAMAELIRRASESYDVVLVDTSPAMVSSDPVHLAGMCDATALVIRAFREKRGFVTRVKSQLEETNTEFLGVLINGVRASAGGYFKRNYRVTHAYNNPKPARDEKKKPKKAKNSKRNGDDNGELAAVAENGAAYDVRDEPNDDQN